MFRSVDSAVLGSSNEAAWVAAPVPPSPGGGRVRVLGAGVRVLRVLRALRWEEGVPVRGHGALHSAGFMCLLSIHLVCCSKPSRSRGLQIKEVSELVRKRKTQASEGIQKGFFRCSVTTRGNWRKARA